MSNDDVAKSAFQDVVSFYNKNEELFLKFEEELGYNPWFLVQHRIQMNYKNYKLGSDGKNVEKEAGYNKVIQRIKVLYWRAIETFYLVYKSVISGRVEDNTVLIFLNHRNLNDGLDVRFDKFTLSHSIVYNRTLYKPGTAFSGEKFLKGRHRNTDDILGRYIKIGNLLRDHKRIKSILNRIKKDLSERVDQYSEDERKILNFFFRYFNYQILYYIRFKSFEKFFSKVNARAILLGDENSPQQKLIQYSASRSGIKIFAFQHGNIFEIHPSYIFGSYNVKPLLPGITFTWGTHFSKLLTDIGGYREDQVYTSGRISPYVPNVILNERIPPNIDIILYASQPQRDPKIRYKLMFDVISAAAKFRDQYKLVIRPHPNESDDKYFRDIGRDAGFQDFIIDRESDLHSQFEKCKLLIVAFSTVGTEFLPYYKPMLVLDYMDQDLLRWIELGVGIPIRSEDDLTDVLRTETIPIDIEAYKKYINMYYLTGSDVLRTIEDQIRSRLQI